MATHTVSASFAVANPSAFDLAVIRAAHVSRIEAESAQAYISRRCEEVGLSGGMVDVGIYLARHGFPMLKTEAEEWFVMGPERYQRLADAGFPDDAETALLGGRWPLVRRETRTGTSHLFARHAGDGCLMAREG